MRTIFVQKQKDSEITEYWKPSQFCGFCVKNNKKKETERYLQDWMVGETTKIGIAKGIFMLNTRLQNQPFRS